MKAVVITSNNQKQLMSRYGAEPEDTDMFPVGYIMVAQWGDNGQERYEGVLTEENFNARFTKGEALQNDFFAIYSKDEVRYSNVFGDHGTHKGTSDT